MDNFTFSSMLAPNQKTGKFILVLLLLENIEREGNASSPYQFWTISFSSSSAWILSPPVSAIS